MKTTTPFRQPRQATVLLALVVWGLLGLAACGAECRVGAAAVDITPPLGAPTAGYYHERGADGVLDPLLCKAMVIESGGERAALVVLDIISVTRLMTDRARTEIEKTTGIKGANVMLSATHTHTGPELVSRGKRSAAMGSRNQSVVEYSDRLPLRAAESVRLANENIGYVADRRSYAEGNYEPESARCAPGSGEKLVDAAARLLEDLHRGPGHATATPRGEQP